MNLFHSCVFSFMQQIALMKKVQFVITVQTCKIRFGLFIAPVELRWLAFGLFLAQLY